MNNDQQNQSGETEKNQPQVQAPSRDARVRVLPAEVYDTLELSAIAFGGIGAGECFVNDEPYCLAGHFLFAADTESLAPNPMRAALLGPRECYADFNDPAVQRINRRRGAPLNARVSFAEWCAELHVVRGDQ